MRPEQPRIEPDAADPFGYKPRVLACRHAATDVSAARKQKFAGLLARRPQIILDRLPGLFGQLELDRPPRLALPDGRPLDRVPGRGDIVDLESHHVTAAQLAVDREIEHGEVSGATLNH